jgi:large conductance mechanosensitive channel
MGFAQEFREFVMKGNVMDLAVGVIIGGAFGKIVDSMVNDLIMPLVSLAVGKIDFTNKFISLVGSDAKTLEEAKKAGAVIAYGSFLTVLLNFIILAFVIFLMIRAINRMRRKEPEVVEVVVVEPPAQERLLMEIRDLLKARGDVSPS